MRGVENEQESTDIWKDVPTLLAAAHELKSPLVLIRQLALGLQDASVSDDPHAALRIRLTAERSLTLIEGLTRAARLEDTLFECEPINVGELYDSVAHELSPLAHAMGQTISIEVPRSQHAVIGNRSLLRSVLIGLCDNALTHNDKRMPVVLKASTQQDNRILIGVKDFGPKTDHMHIIKKRLGHSVQPLSARPRSSGLGLLIAEQFARHMDTHLVLTRHRDEGVTFSLTLPKSRQLTLLDLL